MTNTLAMEFFDARQTRLGPDPLLLLREGVATPDYIYTRAPRPKSGGDRKILQSVVQEFLQREQVALRQLGLREGVAPRGYIYRGGCDGPAGGGCGRANLFFPAARSRVDR